MSSLFFEITREEAARIHAWKIAEVYPTIIAEQRANVGTEAFHQDWWDQGLPYGGAIGGDTTYSFTPTSLGVVVKAHCWGHELDLTDYKSW
jgi:hypothetical protein